MLQGNQRGITIFYASSFACSWVPDIGSQREWRFYERTHMYTHPPLIKLHLQLVY